jgi:hypothetical protein
LVSFVVVSFGFGHLLLTWQEIIYYFCSGLRGRLLSFDEAFDGVEELVRMRPNVPGDLR